MPNTQAAEECRAWLAAERPAIEQELARLLPPEEGPAARLAAAMRHSTLAPGKRLRPILVLESCRACGGSAQTALPAAAAVEMLHTYSLIHDDLPAMDNAAQRRGRTSCHVAFDEATAILAGDALLTRAFAILAKQIEDPAAARAVVAELADAAGDQGMVAGQMMDILGESATPQKEFVESIHAAKTAALFRAATTIGARLAGASEAQLRALAAYGEALGRAFQIVDDLLDREGSDRDLGKPSGQDAAQAKMTDPAVFGAGPSRQRAEAFAAEAIEALEPFGERAERLRGIVQVVLERLH